MKPCQPPEKKFKYGLVIGILVIGICFGFRPDLSGLDFGFSEAYAASGTVLDFDGSNDYIVAADNAVFDQADRLSLSVWIEPDDTPTDDEYIVYRYNNYYIKMNTSRQIVAAVYGAAWTTATSTAVTCDGATWTHIEMTYDKDAGGTDELKLYINGNLSAVADYSTAIPASTKKLYIGSGDEAGDNTPEKGFDGQIDDVRLYSYARSYSDVRLDYNKGLAVHLGPSGMTCAEDPAGCMDYGLVGYWNMDEASGNTAYDISDNNNHGTLSPAGTGPKWSSEVPPSQRGGAAALQFDGTDDYVNVPDSNSLDITNAITLELWVYPNTISNSPVILDKGWSSSYYMQLIDSGTGQIEFGGTSASDARLSSDYVVLANRWNHIVGTFDTITDTIRIYKDGVNIGEGTNKTGSIGVNSNDIRIGYSRSSTNPMNGSIDEVRIYNRALSAEEVRYHYNRGGPVAHWKFDEGEGTKAYDESPNNNDGTLTNFASPPTAASGWTSGKYGSALQFDGTDDVVTVTNNTTIDLNNNLANGFTVSVWVNADTAGEGSGGQIFWKGANTYLRVDTLSGGRLDMEGKLDLATTDANLNISSAIAAGAWNHIVMTYDGAAKITLWINGINKGSNTGSGATAAESNNLLIGGTTTDNFDGTIDDVRIYNYERSAEQIRMDYQQGLSTHLK